MPDSYSNVLESVLRTNCVQDAIETIRDRLGLSHITYHLMVNPGAPLDNPYVRTTYPATWVSHYLLNNYAAIDPVVAAGIAADTSFLWSELTPTAGAIRVMQAAVAHGLPLEGLSVPFKDSRGRKSLFTAAIAGDPAPARDHLLRKRQAVECLARDVHLKALSEFYATDEEMPHLAPRELECLRWVALGKSHTDIAVILGLSEHTVRSYLKTVRLRLDCVSLAQAVTKATRMHMI